MRVAGSVFCIESHKIQQLDDALAPLLSLAQAVNYQRFFDYISYSHSRIERRVRVLKNDLHIATRPPHLCGRKRKKIAPVESYFSRCRFDEPQNAAARRRFAAARLSNKPEGFSAPDRKAYVIDRANHFPAPAQ
jgi:hypothetical protein